jgi:phage shock protein PspC (stress-responsive transcriptional regulator)
MDKATLRRSVYSLLTLITGAVMVARIVGVELVYEPSIATRAWPKDRPEKMPTFSSNDRSRWTTVRSLVEEGTFVIGKREADPTVPEGYRDTGLAFTDGYKSVDYILNPNTNQFFSSKPPLLTTMVAGEYWLLNRSLGWSLKNPAHRWPVVCAILLTFNVLPLLIFLRLLANLLEEYGQSDWGRLFIFASACFGTFLTTFAVTLNNHTPAACCVMFAVYPLLRGRSAEEAQAYRLSQLVVAGFFAGLAFAFDLPAAAFTALLGVIVLRNRPKGAIAYGIAALVPIAALIFTNYLAIGEITPAYDKFGTVWYEYEGSHWKKAKLNPNQTGIDFAKEPKSVYAFHMLLGHHGLFSLTPIWLLALIGMIGDSPARSLQRLNRMALVLTLIVIAFYVYRTNNYGGWTSGPRWQFWLTPLFLLAMIGPADRLAESPKGRRFAMLLLGVAVFSAVYPVWNPWRHPWAYQWCEYMGWLKY